MRLDELEQALVIRLSLFRLSIRTIFCCAT